MSTNKAGGKEVRPRRIRVIMKTGDNIKDWMPPKRSRIERVKIIDGGDDDSFGMEAVRNKLMIDLETGAEMMRSTILEKSKKEEEEEEEQPPPSAAAASVCRWGLRSRSKQVEEKEKHCVCVPLSRSEIEQDFMKMTGSLPLRKPNKWPNFVQKQIDTLFPGLSLTHVTSDLYKVPEPPVLRCSRKTNTKTKTRNK